MKTKINDQLICIPPYISAHWSQITCIESVYEDNSAAPVLKLHLQNQQIISIPDLEPTLIETVFHEHQIYLESCCDQDQGKKDDDRFSSIITSLQQLTNKDTSVQVLSSPPWVSSLLSSNPLDMILQHIPEHKDQPDAPAEILEKVTSILRMFANDSFPSLQFKPEPHCNCLHCQVGRMIIEETYEEEVDDRELTFREWDVVQSGEHLYIVSNPLVPSEQFNVYLGSPIGCTCGLKNCEHIRAVLYT